jgi:hypothetical protein
MELDLSKTQDCLKSQTSQAIDLGKRMLKRLKVKFGKITEYEANVEKYFCGLHV